MHRHPQRSTMCGILAQALQLLLCLALPPHPQRPTGRLQLACPTEGRLPFSLPQLQEKCFLTVRGAVRGTAIPSAAVSGYGESVRWAGRPVRRTPGKTASAALVDPPTLCADPSIPPFCPHDPHCSHPPRKGRSDRIAIM